MAQICIRFLLEKVERTRSGVFLDLPVPCVRVPRAQPIDERQELLPWQLFDGGFDLFDGAHEENNASVGAYFQGGIPIERSRFLPHSKTRRCHAPSLQRFLLRRHPFLVMPATFDILFEQLTGTSPFPWQTALYHLFITGHLPSAADLPTGMGKTSVVTIWLIALITHPSQVPRRLVYVVNRRTVVDQTTSEVEHVRSRLHEHPALLAKLAKLCAIPTDEPLALSSLRGQFADNREWSVDPARPAVIVGTVDMIGSGLLFNRYTCGFKTRPHHAAFLGQDVLLVHDEAHLEPAFQKLLETIRDEQQRAADPRKLHVLALTATQRDSSSAGANAGANPAAPFTLTPDDLNPEVAEIPHKRFYAKKALEIVSVENAAEVRDEILKRALPKDTKNAINRAVLVFVRSVEVAEKIANELTKELGREGSSRVATLTGTMRGKERDELVSANAVFQRFRPEKDRSAGITPATGTVYLVATSAGEVGVNISAADLVCDLSAYESMAQRFGRVNRFGDLADSTITVVYAKDIQEKYDAGLAKANAEEDETKRVKKVRIYEAKNQMTVSLLKTLALLEKLPRDASPAALAALPAADRTAAFSPLPKMRAATAVQFDAWALTSIRESIAARPTIAPYLHGEAEWQPPETHVAWRKEVDIITGDLANAYPPEELLEDFPLKPRELLRDTSERIFDRLSSIAENISQDDLDKLDSWLLHEDGQVEVFPLRNLLASDDLKTIDTDEADDEEDGDDTEAGPGAKAVKDAAKRHKIRIVARLANRTLILPPSFGSLSAQGFLSTENRVETANAHLDISAADDRKRVWSNGHQLPAEQAAAFRLVRAIDTQLGCEDFSDGESDADNNAGVTSTARYWLWLEAKETAGAERHFSANVHQPETLSAHTAAVVGHARAIAEKLFPTTDSSTVGEPNLRRCLTLAAALHDLGKNRSQWQRNIGNLDYDPAKVETILAKSGGNLRPRLLAEHYRHEFGSLFDAICSPEPASALATLSDLERDIVLHLVAAHHGRARPHFPPEEVFDHAAASPAESTAIAMEIPRRFSRLQRRFGRWGLAWLESLLRAADYAASAGIIPLEIGDSSPLYTDRFIDDARRTDISVSPVASLVASPSADTPAAEISIHLNPSNPGHYFACCGLFELAAALEPDARAWFAEDSATFHITATGFSLKELLVKITAPEVTAIDPEDKPLTPLQISLVGADNKQRALRLDWWRHEGGAVGKLKTWAGQMSVRDIADDMRTTLQNELSSQAPGVLEDILSLSSTSNAGEPFYLDANRASNAKARDVGFSVDKLKKGSVRISSTVFPSVELLCLVGLQRTRPSLTVNNRGQEREYDYHLWHKPIPPSLLAAAVSGFLPDTGRNFRFSNPSRAKDYRAFATANLVSQSIQPRA